MAALIPTASASGSGTMTLSGPSTNSNQTITIPDATGTMMVSGNMPAFSAYQGTQQSVSAGTYTKIAFNTKNFDTANCFDATTNYRFTPTIAGYYQINLTAYGVATTMTYIQSAIYKNGTNYTNVLSSAQSATNGAAMVSALIFMNGSTDYVEGYASVGGASGNLIGSTGATNLVQISGLLVRAA